MDRAKHAPVVEWHELAHAVPLWRVNNSFALSLGSRRIFLLGGRPSTSPFVQHRRVVIAGGVTNSTGKERRASTMDYEKSHHELQFTSLPGQSILKNSYGRHGKRVFERARTGLY